MIYFGYQAHQIDIVGQFCLGMRVKSGILKQFTVNIELKDEPTRNNGEIETPIMREYDRTFHQKIRHL